MERGLPVVVALNMVDEARHKGIEIDVEELERSLGVPVVPTVAVTGEGISRLLDRLTEAGPGGLLLPGANERRVPGRDDRWSAIGEVIESVQRVSHRHHTLLDKLEDASVDSFWGLLIGLLVIVGSFSSIRFLGEGVIDRVLDPLFEAWLLPVAERVSDLLGGGGAAHDIIVGHLIDGRIDFEQSLGRPTGCGVPLAMVCPTWQPSTSYWAC